MRDYVQGKQEEQRRKKAHKIHFILLGMGIILCVVGIMWFLHSDVYTVAHITVENIDPLLQSQTIELTRAYIEDRSWFSSLFLNTHSVLGLHTYSLVRKIVETYPILTDVSVSKNYFTRNITITARERKKIALWCEFKDTCWWFDEEGVVFLEGPVTQGQLIDKITSRSSHAILLGKKIPIQGDVSVIGPIFSFLDEMGAPIKNVIWDDTRDEIQTDIHTQFPVIYFSVHQNPWYAAPELKKRVMKNLAYIDLTSTNRIYLCERGSVCDTVQ